MSDNAFFALRRGLSNPTSNFASRARQAHGSAPGAGCGDLNSGAIKREPRRPPAHAENRPVAQDDGGADAARIGGIRQFVDQYFIVGPARRQEIHRCQVAQHIDALFAKNATFRGWFSTRPARCSARIGDIDGATKDGIKGRIQSGAGWIADRRPDHELLEPQVRPPMVTISAPPSPPPLQPDPAPGPRIGYATAYDAARRMPYAEAQRVANAPAYRSIPCLRYRRR